MKHLKTKRHHQKLYEKRAQEIGTVSRGPPSVYAKKKRELRQQQQDSVRPIKTIVVDIEAKKSNSTNKMISFVPGSSSLNTVSANSNNSRNGAYPFGVLPNQSDGFYGQPNRQFDFGYQQQMYQNSMMYGSYRQSGSSLMQPNQSHF